MSDKAPITVSVTFSLLDAMMVFGLVDKPTQPSLLDEDEELVVLLFKLSTDDRYVLEEYDIENPSSPYYELIDGDVYPISDSRALEHVLGQAWALSDLNTLSAWFAVGIDKKTPEGRYTLKHMAP